MWKCGLFDGETHAIQDLLTVRQKGHKEDVEILPRRFETRRAIGRPPLRLERKVEAAFLRSEEVGKSFAAGSESQLEAVSDSIELAC